MLQKSRTLDEQFAFETELLVNDYSQPGQWLSRMVGPGGQLGTQNPGDPPGGFLVIVQHIVNAPLTIDDQLKGITRDVRTDQLMYVYDQSRTSPMDAGKEAHARHGPRLGAQLHRRPTRLR